MNRVKLVLLLGLFGFCVKAQDSFEIYPSLDIRPIMNLKVTDLTNNGLSFNFASVENYKNGIVRHLPTISSGGENVVS